MADHVDITLWIDQRWKDAIEKHLKDETLQEHLENVLDTLCNQLPEREYKRISAEIYAEDAARRTEEEAARTYAAYHVTERGQEWYFKTSPGEELLVACKKLRGYVAAEKGTAPDKFIGMFFGGQPITAKEFDALTAVRMENTGKVRGVFDVNFDKREFSAVHIMDGWQTWAMRDVSAAAYHATRSQFASSDDKGGTMSKYIPFTTEQKERAASVDLEEFLLRRGEKLITSGRDKRLASDHSITIRGCEWFDHATEQGGRAISFVKQFYGLSYPDAMSLLLGDDLGGSYPAAREKEPEPAKPFVLPPQSESMRRVYAYLLQKRCIDREILNAFVRKKLIYESCERSRDGTKEYHNAVFVGFDEHGVPRHGHKRGLYTMGQGYRGNIEGSDPKHSFHYLGGDDTLYVFEAPIDLLSYISLFPEGWQGHNYVACCGTSSIPVLEMLRQLPQLRQVYLCLDNDAAGHAASERMAKLLEERGISAERLVPQQKDWNDDLKAEQENKMERSELCQTFC